jgi:hypothetical protein
LGFTKFEWWLNYLKALPLGREFAVVEDNRPALFELGGALPYVGSVYDPVNHRTWFLPYNQTSFPLWHYLDGRTGKVVAYAHGKGGELTQADAYLGGVYDPVLQRIYLVPTGLRVYEPLWHYIDCETAEVVSYFHGRDSSEFTGSYVGGVYDPLRQRIVLVPGGQSLSAQWHYIDCQTGDVQVYNHGYDSDFGGLCYYGGVYDPVNSRVYFVPRCNPESSSRWHYYDCDTGLIVAYEHGISGEIVSSVAYVGGAFDPIHKRVIFAPTNQGPSQFWHYVDVMTNEVVSYLNVHPADFLNPSSYYGAVFSPLDLRIYFVPIGQGTSSRWHYYDCLTGLIEVYFSTLSSLSAGGSFDPLNHRIYFMSRRDTTWASLQLFSSGQVSRQFGASVFFNQTP